MRTLANDEIDVPRKMTRDRLPTERLRFREVDGGRMILEQLWQSQVVGVEDAWVPVRTVAATDRGAE